MKSDHDHNIFLSLTYIMYIGFDCVKKELESYVWSPLSFLYSFPPGNLFAVNVGEVIQIPPAFSWKRPRFFLHSRLLLSKAYFS